jgi:HEAT repeat protein
MASAQPSSLVALLEQLQLSIAGGTDWVEDCREPFRVFLGDARGFAAAQLNGILAELDRNPAHQSREWDFKQIVLAEDGSYALLCSIFDEPLEHIYCSSFRALVGVLGPASLPWDRYELPGEPETWSREAPRELILAETGLTRPLEHVSIDGRTEAYDFRVSAPTILVRLFRNGSEPLHHIYDRQSLRPWLVQAGDTASTQIVCLANALEELGDASSVAVLEQASHHPHHFVRWSAIQAISALHEESAMRCLRAALTDSHADIRDAARRTLARIAETRGAQ